MFPTKEIVSTLGQVHRPPFPLLTQRRAVDLCRVRSSLCLV
ncbi:putative leader peptide [Amycolatopsis sp.]